MYAPSSAKSSCSGIVASYMPNAFLVSMAIQHQVVTLNHVLVWMLLTSSCHRLGIASVASFLFLSSTFYHDFVAGLSSNGVGIFLPESTAPLPVSTISCPPAIFHALR